MISRFFQAAALLLIGSLVAPPVMAETFEVPAFLSQARQQAVKDRYIVVFKKGSVSTDDVEKRYNVVRARIFEKVLNGFSAHLTADQLSKLKKDARVDFIEPDIVVTALGMPALSKNAGFDWDAFFKHFASSSSAKSSVSSVVSSAKSSVTSSAKSSAQSSSVSSSSKSSAASSVASSVVSVPTGIDRIDAEKSHTAAIDGVANALDVDVAVIDTGIDLAHPDLTVYRNVNLIDSSKNGNDDNGHGTHVSGTIAAKDDGKGVVGVAPGARLWAVKVLDQNGSGLMSDIIKGIDYVTQHASEIEVANLSLGCQCQSAALDNALNNAVNAGIVFAVAAGNSGADASTFSPANNPNVITVSAMADFNGAGGGGASATCRTDVDDTFADFSNFGAPVDIAAPGVCITSTYTGGGYAVLSGTSMASPHVAGAAALYIAGHGRATNASGVASIKSALISAATPQNNPDGFTGDPDGSPEPLLNVAGF